VRKPKVDETSTARCAVVQKVGRLDITVDDVKSVHTCQCFQQRAHIAADVVLGHVRQQVLVIRRLMNFFFCLLFYYLDPRVLKVLEDKDDLVVKTQSLDQSDDVVLPTGQLQEPGLVVDPCR